MNIVNKTTLKKEYISIDGSFGGNQRWLRVDENKANTLSDYGCGLISANDVLLYISDHPTDPSKEKYIAAIRDMNRRYFRVLPFLGLSGILMSFYMKLYLLLHKKHFKSRYKVHWGVMPHNLLKRIEEMLNNDIPVILSIGPCLIRGRKKELPLYDLNYKQINSVKDHYVNITAIIKTDSSTMLEISSWGKKYYINYDEYKKFVKKYDNFLFSNILYIKKS